MALPTAIVISVYLLLGLYYSKKQLSFLQNSLIFMIISIAARNYTTIMSMQLKWFHLTEDSLLFLVFLLHRDVIGPILVLIFINGYWTFHSGKMKVFLYIIFLICLQLMDFFSVGFGVITYTKWSFLKAGLANSAFLFAGLGLSKGILYFKRERSNYDNSI
ncbi:hypothetical protein DFO73_11223 [Cytobacillus oceanisediminis]|jgi:hypothetical protein|uniref:Uncharacterized protein n=1 Tax=Cytobacillus oceanisediminis TaxID=665099 RepID=A0A2V2ZN43_9BACI|nr:hypothetical protein [Cytobacillus oceanisediminis]PWW25731.1 hypothetical protein DFO73_11223 [Cytobacillus oceanisediminis]